MTDELFDYFGGNSSRKMEPIEDDELLMDDDGGEPKSELPPKETSESESKASDDSAGMELGFAAFEYDETSDTATAGDGGEDVPPEEAASKPAKAKAKSRKAGSSRKKPAAEMVVDEAEEDLEAEPVSTDDPGATEGADPWASLASDLGIEVPEAAAPAPSPPESKPVGIESPDQSERKGAPSGRSRRPKRKERPKRLEEPAELAEPTAAAEASEDFFGVGLFPTESGEDDEAVLSEMFVPSDLEEFDEPEPANSRVVDDVTLDEDVDVDDDPGSVLNENEIEFEITDLDGNADEDPRRKKRRRRRRGRGTAAASVEPADTGDEMDDTQEVEEEGRRGRRRRRKPKSRREDLKVEREDREELALDEPDSDDRGSKRRRRRSSRERDDVAADHDRDTRDDKKSDKPRPKIPTWDEAISVVVEKNLSGRHKGGGGNSGRRRKRRR